MSHGAPPLRRQCPEPSPNTAEYDESSAVSDMPGSLPLFSFDDSSEVSSASLLDTQGFALGVSDDTHSPGLSLPSEPPDLDLRDWILRRRIEASQQNYVHEKSAASSPESPKFSRPSSQNESSSAAHHQYTDEHTESEGSKRKLRSIFCKKNWDGLTSSIGADSEIEQHLHLPSGPTNQLGDLCDETKFLEGVPEPSCLNNGSAVNEIEAVLDHGEQEEEDTASVSAHSKIDDESENSVTEDETDIHVDENGMGIQDSSTLSSNIMKPAKENSLEVRLPVSFTSTRSTSRHFLRKPLSDTGNLLLGPEQSQHASAKWRCPKIDKRHYKPRPKQLCLDRWLLPPK